MSGYVMEELLTSKLKKQIHIDPEIGMMLNRTNKRSYERHIHLQT
jgi:hypothetical protein